MALTKCKPWGRRHHRPVLGQRLVSASCRGPWGAFSGCLRKHKTEPRVTSVPSRRTETRRLGVPWLCSPRATLRPLETLRSRTKTTNRAPTASAPTTPSDCPSEVVLTSQSGRRTAPHDAVSRHTKCTFLASCDRNQPDGANLRDRQRPSPKTPYFVGSGPDMQFVDTP